MLVLSHPGVCPTPQARQAGWLAGCAAAAWVLPRACTGAALRGCGAASAVVVVAWLTVPTIPNLCARPRRGVPRNATIEVSWRDFALWSDVNLAVGPVSISFSI